MGMAGPSGLVGMTGSERPVGITGAEGPEGAEGAEGAGGRGPGTAGPCGLAWPPRSLELPDTIGLPVTFAVSARGLFP